VVEGQVERYERLNGDKRFQVRERVAPKRKILYIEDNLSNLRLVERILSRDGDIEIVSAMQGRLGPELAREHQPELILLDLHLPDTTGDEVLRQLRDDPSTASIPVAVKTPGPGGKITRAIPSVRARSQACAGPEPPKASSPSPRGSSPRSTVTARIARTMLALAISRTPIAACSTDSPSGLASNSSMVWRAAATSSSTVPPASVDGSIPSTTLASVTVGHSPPSP